MSGNPLASIPSFGPFSMTESEFEQAVSDAMALVPADLRREMDNVVIFVADDFVPGPDDDPDLVLLGLYEGTPLTARDSWWGAGSLPDRITIFRRPILAACTSRDEVVREVTITVIHEIAHHFGIDDDRLHELGWG
ncbi:metallopeptidase family protein [Specibacter cremeus]|uniref:metallopeptidase family protein n=1 Tax=Specibacter cremeus TaxID=1629051 RepID=UPI001F0C1BDB|nr:metallopeptidase family protein [Specibacter cremeus]